MSDVTTLIPADEISAACSAAEQAMERRESVTGLVRCILSASAKARSASVSRQETHAVLRELSRLQGGQNLSNERLVRTLLAVAAKARRFDAEHNRGIADGDFKSGYKLMDPIPEWPLTNSH